MAGRALSKVIEEFPDIRIEKVEFLTQRARAREAGVKLIPALVSGERKLSGVLLTKAKIRAFLRSLR